MLIIGVPLRYIHYYLPFLFRGGNTDVSYSGFAIPISKRTGARDANGVVDIARLQRSASQSIAKINRGFRAYEQNTGIRHPSAPEVSRSEKRNIGSDLLVDMKWYSNISVGTPAMTFTGTLSLLTYVVTF